MEAAIPGVTASFSRGDTLGLTLFTGRQVERRGLDPARTHVRGVALLSAFVLIGEVFILSSVSLEDEVSWSVIILIFTRVFWD